MKPIFIFCGLIGSGKSSVSKLFAKGIGAKWNSFGTATRDIAGERGVQIQRENLQSLGAHLIKNERELFCKRVLAPVLGDGTECGVVDGLRHAHVLRELRAMLSPRKIICIYVEVSTEERLDRVGKRDGLNADQLAILDSHSTEVEVKTELRKLADFVADNSGTPEECVSRIQNWAKA
ncbi:MAG TPA: AAA family ATPase [Candidatus Acidoferrales bacterium]|nr:AAA family ATPase [Candidatus Acidoferrales bacterium]